MKKSRIAAAIVLAVVLAVTCANVPTFSWFTRPQSQSGEKMMLNTNQTYNAYNGYNVSVSTMGSTDSGISYTTDCNAANACSGSGLGIHNRKYFCTTITNSDTAAQNVSLYARTLSIPTANNGSLAIGVNGPTRSYHDYSTRAAQTTTANRDAMRIYFQKPKSAPDGWTGTEFYICWNEDPNTGVESLDATGSNGTYYKMNYCGEKDGYYNYYSDIPMTATHAFFACENWGTNNNGQPNYKQRTQTLWNLNSDGQTQLQSKVYQLTSTVSNGNTTVHTPPYSVNGACINHYYSSIFVTKGSTYDAALSNTNRIPVRDGYTANYIGNLEYYSGNENIFTVGKTTGEITPVSAGEATLYTKAVGASYSDEQQVETTIKVTAAANYVFNDVPIVKNIQMNAGDVVEVYWYVINNSLTNALSYTIDEVYIGL